MGLTPSRSFERRWAGADASPRLECTMATELPPAQTTTEHLIHRMIELQEQNNKLLRQIKKKLAKSQDDAADDDDSDDEDGGE